MSVSLNNRLNRMRRLLSNGLDVGPAMERLEDRKMLTAVGFDPDGPGALEYLGFDSAAQLDIPLLTGLDWNPGNALAKDGAPLTVGSEYTLYYQAKLSAFNLEGGGIATNFNDGSGLLSGIGTLTAPATFEWTVSMRVKQIVTDIVGDTAFMSVVNDPSNYLKLFYDTNVNANDATGIGFTDGHEILSASTFVQDNTAFEIQGTGPFDSDPVTGSSLIGSGSFNMKALVDTWDNAFIDFAALAGGQDVVQLSLITSTLQLPFGTASPAAQFEVVGDAPIIPDHGAVNGVSGPDFHFQADANQDFETVVLPKAAIGDYVWYDKNADGIQDGDEDGIEGVTVHLLDASDNILDSMLTDANGKYLFDNLTPGDYKIQFVAPPGLIVSDANQGADDAIDSDGEGVSLITILTTLDAGETDLTWDQGFYELAEIGDYVWEDKNIDGIQDADEDGIEGVKVELYNCEGDVFVAETTTDADGKYLFTGLKPGTYHVKFYTPTGYILTTQDVGANDAIDSDAHVITGEAICTELESGESDLTWDAGMYRLAALGDYVWFDADKDGQQDGDEVGVEGVTVHLLDSSDNILETMLTDGAGFYLFDNLLPGSYKVQFELPAGFDGFTLKDTGSDVTDSDADLVTGITGVYILFSGDVDLTVDAGLVKSVDNLRPEIDIEKYIKVIGQPGGGEGLTPGYWKQAHHFDDWTNFSPADNYNAVFGVNDDPSLTLLDALKRGGGENKALGRHAVAAILNASHPNIEYDMTVAQIIAAVQNAYATNNFEPLKNQLDAFNNQGADLSSGGNGGGGGGGGIGDDADLPTGPIVVPGDQLMFTYIVTNPGEVELSNVVVTDDNATPGNPGDDFNPTPTLAGGFNVGDLDMDNKLDVGEEWVYTAMATAGGSGQFKNIGTVTGTSPESEVVTDEDPAHWLILNPDLEPEINIEKYVKSESAPVNDLGDDADSPTGPSITLGEDAIFTYLVTNTGNVELSNVNLTDDNATPGDIADDFAPIPVLSGAFNVGDTDQDGNLDVGETWKYMAAVTTLSTGQYVNIANVSATAPDATIVEDSDPAHYRVEQPQPNLEGFTPGFWKQKQHFQYWVGYSTSMKFETVFGVNITGSNYSLLQALSLGGGGMNALMRHAVAALLNASNSEVNYTYSTTEVISMVQQAFASGDYETTKNLFEAANEMGGSIN